MVCLGRVKTMKKQKLENTQQPLNQFFDDTAREIQFHSVNRAVNIRSAYPDDSLHKLKKIAMTIYREIKE